MKLTFWKSSGIMALTILMIAFISQIQVRAQDDVVIDDEDEQLGSRAWNPKGLEGVWRVTITPRNCVTGVPVPTAAFASLFTFHKGGTLSVSLQNSTITITRSLGHGLWQRERLGRREPSWGDFSFKFVHLRLDLATGAYLASQVARGTLQLSESGDEFTTNSSTTSFDVNGVSLPGMGCANAVGTRFE